MFAATFDLKLLLSRAVKALASGCRETARGGLRSSWCGFDLNKYSRTL